MALITCPECRGTVSDSASVCPHCGYQIEEYTKKMKSELEITRLMEKIKPVEFVCPEPRVKVCIKCGEPFYSRTGEPTCECQFPGVEVDYPEQGYDGHIDQFLYILNHDIIPRNIGDTESEEYRECISGLYEQIKGCERVRKSCGQVDWEIKPIPPDPKDFGVSIEYEEPYIYTPPAPKPIKPIPHCPFCNSTNLTKISSVGKAVKISLFGLFGADDLGKTYKCNNCGGKF